MKLKNKILTGLIIVVLIGACTSDFETLNENPNLIGIEDASAKYFLTELMVRPYIPTRYEYWRAHLIHVDRYAGHFTFGHNQSWWSDDLGYQYNAAYTDAAWDHYNGILPTLKSLLKFTEPGGEFENELTYSVVLILKSHYYHLFTDVFGEIPYSQLFQEDISLPVFDTQKDIYKGIIADLNTAMATIGDNTTTGDAKEDLGANDLIYGGDLQKWKRFANTLKLRVAMRAEGASGDDFSATAISEALAAPLLGEGESALIKKDLVISQWAYSTYGDVWYNFGGGGSKWTVGRDLINYLRDNNDPRLKAYAKPSVGGKFKIERPKAADNQIDHDLFPKRAAFIKDVFDEAGASYTWMEYADSLVVEMPEDVNYIGQPVRLNGRMASLAQYDFFSRPSESVIMEKGKGGEATPETVLLSAESFFLQAEAIVKGMTQGDAQEKYQMGIKEAMRVWKIDDGAIDAFLANEDMALLNGTEDEKLEKIAIQRWIANYTDGYEAWAVVRDTGYPASLANGVSDYDIYGPGNITGGAYPNRLRYGSSLQTSNPENYNAAIARQGADLQETKLWWEK